MTFRLFMRKDSEGYLTADTVILGAFGCGAFRNDPHAVASAAANVLSDYIYAFENIEFAVYCRPNDDFNYRVFNSVLSSL